MILLIDKERKGYVTKEEFVDFFEHKHEIESATSKSYN